MNHIGYQKTIGTFDDTLRHYDELERHLEMLNGDGAWRSVSDVVIDLDSTCLLSYLWSPQSPAAPRIEMAINEVKVLPIYSFLGPIAQLRFLFADEARPTLQPATGVPRTAG